MKTVEDIIYSEESNDLWLLGLFNDIIQVAELYEIGRYTQADKLKNHIKEKLDALEYLKPSQGGGE